MWNPTSPRWAALMMIAILMTVYCLWPLIIHFSFHSDKYFIQLALMSVVASCSIALGALPPILDRQFKQGAPRLAIPPALFHGILWILFVVFFIITLATADAVPFISALTGASENELSLQRGEFLITRQGWQGSLVYVGTALTSALLPYSLMRLILDRSKWSIPAGGSLFAFMESFLVKAMFLQIALPLAYLAATKRRWIMLTLVTCGSVGLLLLNTYIQKANVDIRTVAPITSKPPRPTSSSASNTSASNEPYFTARYTPRSASDHLIWRMISIPTITAADALRVFDEKFHHRYLLGSTSTAIATIFRLERVNYDSHVFAYQWGKSEFGRSNSTYLTEAYINFGWAGVIVFSFFVGQSLRWFHQSKDEAFRALWLVYVYFLAQGSLLGTLFSNAFCVLFLISLFVSIKSPGTKS